MKLYGGPLSLFSRKVEVALREKSLPYDRFIVPFTQSHGYSPRNQEVMAANPKGQVPVLIDGDLTLYDSTVILEYLEDAYPEPPLYPNSPAERARCRLHELYADEILLTPVRALMHRTGPRSGSAEQQAAQDAGALRAEPLIAGHYNVLEERLGGRDYLCGTFSAADIATFMTVLYALRLGGPALGPFPALSAWYGRLRARPAFAGIREEILAADRELSVPVSGPGQP